MKCQEARCEEQATYSMRVEYNNGKELCTLMLCPSHIMSTGNGHVKILNHKDDGSNNRVVIERIGSRRKANETQTERNNEAIARNDKIALGSLAGVICSMLGAFYSNDMQRFFEMSIGYSKRAIKELSGDITQH